jgi:hypothetical protein
MRTETSRTHTLVVVGQGDTFVEHPLDCRFEHDDYTCLVAYITRNTGLEDLKENDPDNKLTTPGRYDIAAFSHDSESLFEDNELYLYFGKGDDNPQLVTKAAPDKVDLVSRPEPVDPVLVDALGKHPLTPQTPDSRCPVGGPGDLGVDRVLSADERAAGRCWCGKSVDTGCWKCEGRPESSRSGDVAR